jgi:uncharacterized protein YjbI with pentapeptide repeats
LFRKTQSTKLQFASGKTGGIKFTTPKTTNTKAAVTTNLTGANLTDANLTDANLTDANLTRANLTACSFYMGSSNKNFEALCKAIKTIKWNSNTGADFIKQSSS